MPLSLCRTTTDYAVFRPTTNYSWLQDICITVQDWNMLLCSIHSGGVESSRVLGIGMNMKYIFFHIPPNQVTQIQIVSISQGF